MRLLDLFCGAGGCSVGYGRAGFDVVGVDHRHMPAYPFEFHQADALEYLANHWKEFDAIHASPPCQAHSSMASVTKREYEDLIPATRNALLSTGLPYIIENVPGAPIERSLPLLCGTMFGLEVIRHRAFEVNWDLGTYLLAPHNCKNSTITGKTVAFRNGGRVRPGRNRPLRTKSSDFRDSMGCHWMTCRDARQAIPPAYTEFIGKLLLAELSK